MAMINGKDNMSASPNMNAMIGNDMAIAIEVMGPTAVAAIQANFRGIEEIHLDDNAERWIWTRLRFSMGKMR
eukprot:scaffold26270_cov60-Attheya_sp.AAC.6